MFKSKKDLQGNFVFTGNMDELNKTQALRVILCALVLFLFLIPELFLPQAINKYLQTQNLLAILQTYVILVFFALLLMIYTLVCSLTRYKLKRVIPERQAPVSGWDKHTWASHEWQFFVLLLLSLSKIVGLFFAFDVISLLLAFISVACTAISFYIARITFLSYKGKMQLVEGGKSVERAIEELDKAHESETEDFYDED